MSLPDQTPKLPSWIFFVTDAAFLAAAWLVFDHSPRPLPLESALLVTGLVFLGAVVALVPLVVRYERRKTGTLDERQRSLEALSRTVANSAEQISIAANGLHQIVEIAQKNLKQAEQLPHKLQDKISEFNAQLDNARDDDREELEKEIAELRSTESERLATLADKIQKSVAELAKLDAAAQKHLASRTELIERAENAATRVNTDAAVAISESLAIFTRELSAAESKTLAAIDAKLRECTAAVIAAIEAAGAKAAASLASAPPASAPTAPATETAPAPAAAATAEIASPPKRPRKPRRDDAPPSDAPQTPPVSSPAPAVVAEPPTPTEPAVETPPPPADEPRPIPAETIPAIEPVAPRSDHPFPEESPPSASAPAVETAAIPAPTPEPAAEPTAPPVERPARKRAPRKPEPDPTPSLDLQLDDTPTATASDDAPVTARDVVESVLSSDGATRLIATAYIGIGNRLFIRGDGPGLSWEKGVPLQFVSIGKWRWETSDAVAPIRFKLYKNDEIECAALGELTLDPGHQQEVSARF